MVLGKCVKLIIIDLKCSNKKTSTIYEVISDQLYVWSGENVYGRRLSQY